MIRAEYVWNDQQPIDVSKLPPIPLEPEGNGVQSMAIRTCRSTILVDYKATMSKTLTSHHFDEHGAISDDIPDGAPQTRSALVVPMKHNGDVIGVIQVQSNRINAFQEHHLRLLESLSVYASAAISLAKLNTQAERDHYAHSKLETERTVYQKLLEESDEGVMLWCLGPNSGDNLVLLAANHAAMRMLGQEREDLDLAQAMDHFSGDMKRMLKNDRAQHRRSRSDRTLQQ